MPAEPRPGARPIICPHCSVQLCVAGGATVVEVKWVEKKGEQLDPGFVEIPHRCGHYYHMKTSSVRAA